MKTSQAGINLIKSFEGLRLNAYRDIVGVWTIGYGHTSEAGPPKVHDGLKITEHEAEDILRRDLGQYEEAVSNAIKRPMNENQFAACVSLCYNIGPAHFAKSSVVRRFNAGETARAAEAFLMWTKAGGRAVLGLQRRRHEEQKLFLTEVAHV